VKLREDDVKKALAGMKNAEWELPAGFADQVMTRVRRERRRPVWMLAAAAAGLIAAGFATRSLWSPAEEPAAPLAVREADLRELEALREDYERLLLDLENARMLSREPVVPLGSHEELDLFLDVRSLMTRPPPSARERVIPVSGRPR